MVRGAVPGASNGFVLVSDAVKKKLPDGAPFPAFIASPADEEVKEPDPVVSAEETNSKSDDDGSKE